ncbi:hypothetical protein P8452_47358 [Trifolium repens]|nr:hypothetical protein P8452_47358 [Trifolium repens]
MNCDTWRDPNDVDVMHASTYAVDEKRFTVFLRLHTSTFDHAATVALLKELMWLVAGRGGGDDRGEAKDDDKVNLIVGSTILGLLLLGSIHWLLKLFWGCEPSNLLSPSVCFLNNWIIVCYEHGWRLAEFISI